MHLGSFLLGIVAAFGLSTLACVVMLRRCSRQREARAPLRLVGPESPQEHVRNALAILDEMQREVIHVGLLVGTAGDVATYELLKLVAAARGRCWAAVAALERPNHHPALN